MPKNLKVAAGILALAGLAATGRASDPAVERSGALRLADAWLDSAQAYHHVPAVSAGVVVGEALV